jgi:hypothetical protein
MASNRTRLLVLAALLAALPAAAGEIYRWVDPGGTAHYGEAPPLGAKAERVWPPPPPGPSPNLDALRARDEANAKLRADAAVASAKQAVADAAMAERCAAARGQLEYLDSRPASRIAKAGPDGELQRLTAEEHDARRASAEARIAENCR